MFDPLPADLAAAIEREAARLGAFHGLQYVTATDSTNDLALALAAQGEPEGVAVLAEVQRRGRGRRGRAWFSPAGAGIYLSVILRPAAPDRCVSLVTLGAGAAVARAVRAVAGLPVQLKWPNDVVIGQPWRKLGGILSEAATIGSRLDAMVVGIGVNLQSAAYPRELASRATSIESELGRPIDRALLVVEILAQLAVLAGLIHAAADEALCDAWREYGREGLLGAPVRWEDQGRVHRGRARDIDRDGALLVEEDGAVTRLIAGEVIWEGRDGE